jgi:hypothetical protein
VLSSVIFASNETLHHAHAKVVNRKRAGFFTPSKLASLVSGSQTIGLLCLETHFGQN